MATNIVQKFGVDYFNQSFRDAYFKREGLLHRVIEANTRWLVCVKYSLPAGGNPLVNAPLSEEVRISTASLTDMGMFTVPELGYRSVGGLGLIHVTRKRSYYRGVQPSSVRVVPSSYMVESMEAAGLDYNSSIRGLTLMYHLFFPDYTPYDEGLRKIMEGDALCFALSPAFAVGIYGDGIGVFFKGRPVGTISPEGTVNMTVPSLNKSFDRVVMDSNNGP